MFVVGLTGGIGSGKTTVSQRFEHHGIVVVDADTIAREVVAPGSEGLEKITARFGPEILLANGSLDRQALRKIIFSNESERHWLESLTHPLIRTQIEARIQAAPGPYAILSAPLLLESGHYNVNRVLIVDLPVAEQVTRASARDNADRGMIEKIIASQMPRTERLKHADDIVDNAGSLEQTLSQVDALHLRYLQLADITLNDH
ncbi:dephospho-CoA kinase [Teredinibacter turnerae]|uniref:dephospho-CoA kinase n=1 Tax=Teredinibacter turnerae TaxID=2426 RepID=UPI0003780B83|nr:dephospho-CoA kinase [Teredinibacter turnerae]